MKTISLADITMRQEAGKNALNFREKIELAKLLDKLGVSVIELGQVRDSKADRLLIKSIGAAVRNSTVAADIGLDIERIAPVWDALSHAAHPRLQVHAPVSAVQMEYLAGKKPAKMLEGIQAALHACRECCEDVELIADDATRADPAFLKDVIALAAQEKVHTLTLCDTAGELLPEQFGEFISGLYSAAPELKELHLGIACSNLLSMADACAVSAIRCGADEIKCCAYGTQAASLVTVATVLKEKGAQLDASATLHAAQLRQISGQITRLCNLEPNSAAETKPQNDREVYLTVHDDQAAVTQAIEALGYELSDEDCIKVYEAFSRIAAKKETVSEKELNAIIASAAMQVPPTYQLDSYVINTGNTISATAHMKLSKDGEMKEGISIGDGPIDAAFLAIEQVVGHHYELDDFQIQAVTRGREAMGEAVVRLRDNGKLFSGRGISTDIVGASIRAYLSALNKLTYEQNEL